ncbi:MAG: RsmB/NOP family class I SAM-dependent RNA methyltransferase [Sphingomonadales bacterium]
MNKSTTKIGLYSRKVAHQALLNVLERGVPLSTALSDIPGYLELETNDKALAKQLLMTTLRRYNQLDSVINPMLDKPLGPKGLPVTLWMMLGAAQILFMNVENYAAVNTTVEMVSRDRKSSVRAKKNLVNAILRNITREFDTIKFNIQEKPKEALAPWLRERWEKQFDEKILLDIISEVIKEPKLDLSFQSLKALEDFALKFNGTVLKPLTLRLTPQGPIEKMRGFKSGLWWVQDIAASIPVHLMGDVRGKSVLDLCAAPGGKTLQLLSKGASVISVDKSITRVKILRNNLKRLGKESTVIVEDALNYKPKELFDTILLDAPCSATGTLRKHPDLMLLKNGESIKSLFSIQEKLLKHAFNLLKSNGTIIYCVCSLEQEEGIDQISNFLEKTPTAKRVKILKDELGILNESLTPLGDVFILPTHIKEQGGADGFYISRITKTID